MKEGDMTQDIYVVVAENDKGYNKAFGADYGGPLVFEQYTRSADLNSIKDTINRLGGRFGKCRIAKLQFLDEE